MVSHVATLLTIVFAVAKLLDRFPHGWLVVLSPMFIVLGLDLLIRLAGGRDR
jgi:hypothetical protein